MTSHASIDESVRGPNYCLCATLVPGHRLAAARSHMRSLLISGQRYLHFASDPNLAGWRLCSVSGFLRQGFVCP